MSNAESFEVINTPVVHSIKRGTVADDLLPGAFVQCFGCFPIVPSSRDREGKHFMHSCGERCGAALIHASFFAVLSRTPARIRRRTS
jgi:hypothetical protein